MPLNKLNLLCSSWTFSWTELEELQRKLPIDETPLFENTDRMYEGQTEEREKWLAEEVELDRAATKSGVCVMCGGHLSPVPKQPRWLRCVECSYLTPSASEVLCLGCGAVLSPMVMLGHGQYCARCKVRIYGRHKRSRRTTRRD